MNQGSVIGRRDMIAGIAMLIGAASLPTDVFAANLSPAIKLSPTVSATLSAIADTLIPATDTPGALVAKVPEKFERLLSDWASEESRTLLLGAVDRIDLRAADTKGKKFAQLAGADRKALLVAHEQTALNPIGGDPGYAKLKKLIILLFFTSETALTHNLNYDHVPGKWIASVKVTPETRSDAPANIFAEPTNV